MESKYNFMIPGKPIKEIHTYQAEKGMGITEIMEISEVLEIFPDLVENIQNKKEFMWFFNTDFKYTMQHLAKDLGIPWIILKRTAILSGATFDIAFRNYNHYGYCMVPIGKLGDINPIMDYATKDEKDAHAALYKM